MDPTPSVSVVHEPSRLESLGIQLLVAWTGVDEPTRLETWASWQFLGSFLAVSWRLGSSLESRVAMRRAGLWTTLPSVDCQLRRHWSASIVSEPRECHESLMVRFVPENTGSSSADRAGVLWILRAYFDSIVYSFCRSLSNHHLENTISVYMGNKSN